jgi:hypothetical protein
VSVVTVAGGSEMKGAMSSPLRVAIEAQIVPGEEGGLEAFLQALVAGLGEASGRTGRSPSCAIRSMRRCSKACPAARGTSFGPRAR